MLASYRAPRYGATVSNRPRAGSEAPIFGPGVDGIARSRNKPLLLLVLGVAL